MLQSTAMAGEYYLWSVDGKPISVLLGLPVVERLGALIHHSAETRGVLLGTVLARGRHPAIVVDDFEPFDSTPDELSGLRDRSPVGVFHSRPNGEFRLDRDDASLIERLFHHPELVYLLIKPSPGEPAKAAFFIQEKGKMQGFAAYRVFPFHATLLRSGRFPLSDGRTQPRTGVNHAAKIAVVMAVTTVALLGGWGLNRSMKKTTAVAAVNSTNTVQKEEVKVSPVIPAPPRGQRAAAPPRIPRARTPIVGIESVPPGRMQRIVGRIPGVRSLTRVRYNSGDQFRQPRLIRRTLPSLPDGVATDVPIDIRLRVNERGRVANLRVIKAAERADLTRSASRAAREWVFEPARLNGRPVSSDVILHFTFPGTH